MTASTPIAIGMCGRIEQLTHLAPGYDFLELMVTEALRPLEDDASFDPSFTDLQAMRPPVRAFNVFVDPAVRLTGPEVDWDLVAQYVSRGVRRAARLGARIIVFGSGPAREIPEGYPYDEAWAQLVRFLHLCADAAQGTGVTIAIEPLYGSNIIKTYLEGVDLAREVQRPEVMVLADVIHFTRIGEPLEDILKEPSWLAHVHLCDTERRPPPGRDPELLRRLFGILKEIGYRGMASVEANWGGDDYTAASAETLSFLRSVAE